MVEMTRSSMFRSIVTITLSLCAVAGCLYAQPPRLESNREYVALLEEDKALQMQQDSIGRTMENLRGLLRTNPDLRERVSTEILWLESRMFEIRSAKGRLVDRINALEQEWVLAQLEGADAWGESGSYSDAQPAVVPAFDGPKVRNLVYNGYFRENLPEADYLDLLKSQECELQAEEFARRYFQNYAALSALVPSYEAATAEAEAMEIYNRFQVLTDANRQLADSLAAVWNYIFDNKNYAYGYVLDKHGNDRLLTAQENRLTETMLQLAELRNKTVSDQVADYFLRKRTALDYELEVAQLLGLDAACDSLAQAAKRLKAVDFTLPKIDLIERFFIDYEELTFPKTPQYTVQHPIPACRIYERGTIYRILLGTYAAKRPVSLFKGAYPLSYLLDDAKKWSYYAGGFATLTEAEAAQQQLKEKGFVRPEIVVWTNGVARNLSQHPELSAPAYRVEISNTEVLPDDIRSAIAAVAGEAEVSKVGQRLFVVGLFYDRALADTVAEAVRKTDDKLLINVTEMAR